MVVELSVVELDLVVIVVSADELVHLVVGSLGGCGAAGWCFVPQTVKGGGGGRRKVVAHCGRELKSAVAFGK